MLKKFKTLKNRNCNSRSKKAYLAILENFDVIEKIEARFYLTSYRQSIFLLKTNKIKTKAPTNFSGKITSPFYSIL